MVRAKTKAKAKPKPKPKKKSAKKPAPKRARPRAKPKKKQPAVSGGGAIVRILDAKRPLEALTKFLAKIDGALSLQEGQIVLGSAHLLLAGGADANTLLDLVLSRWADLPDRTGFHAQELLRNAFAAVGGDRARVMQLSALVPVDASAELRLGHACALAAAGERTAMLRAVEAALAAGVSPGQVRRAPEMVPYADEAGFVTILERASAPVIPVDIAPHVEVVRAALDDVTRMLREFGEHVVLEPPASLDVVLASERTAKIQLPNDYRALLTLTDGMTLTDNRFFGTVDYRNETKLARDAREFVARLGHNGSAYSVDECVPLANWGQPTDWLLYDPYGRLRGGAPGYLLRVASEQVSLDGLAHALERFERIMRDVLGTN
jgi:hypothetical protein